MAKQKIDALFRVDKTGDFKNVVVAVFPEIPGTRDPYTFTTYERIGQHGIGSLDWYEKTRAAKPEEYTDLLREIQGIYAEYDIQVKNAMRAKYLTTRQVALRKQA